MATVGHQQRQPQQQAPPSQTTQLEFHQAMRDFKTMFPEMDEDVIEVVLRANQGAVDATIDQLLAMSTDNENERLRTEMDATENAEAPPGYSPTTPPPTYQQAVPNSPGVVAPAAATAEIKTATIMATSSSSLVGGGSPAPPQRPPPSGSRPGATLSANNRHPCNSDVPDAEPEAVKNDTDPTSTVPLRVQRNWSPAIIGPLPCDFLRIALPNGRLLRTAKCCEGFPNPRSMDAVTKRGLYRRVMTMCCRLKSAGMDHGEARVQPQDRDHDELHPRLSTVLCSEVIQKKIEENRRQREMGHPEDPELAQYLEDERIALFLQNKEFMTELRSNRDFLTTLERDARSQKPEEGGWPAAYDSDEEESSSDTEKPPKEALGALPCTKNLPAEESDAAFREKLKNMGKLSRRKFAQLARLFSRQKKRSAKQMYPYARLSEGSMPSKDNLLLDENDEGSLSDDEDSNKPQNEYHLIKSSASPKHNPNSGPSAKHD